MTCSTCQRPISRGKTTAYSGQTRCLVFVVADNYGSDATIIDVRDSDDAPASHYKVRTDDGQEFWAFDF